MQLHVVDGLQGPGGQDGLVVAVLHEGCQGAVEGDGRHQDAPAAGKLEEGGVLLSASQEPEEEGQGEEQGGDGDVHGEGAQPEDEGEDAPQGKHHLLALEIDTRVDASSAEGAVEGDGHPEGAVAAESDGTESVLALILEEASHELGEATEEEAEGEDQAGGGTLDHGGEHTLQKSELGGFQVGYYL